MFAFVPLVSGGDGDVCVGERERAGERNASSSACCPSDASAVASFPLTSQSAPNKRPSDTWPAEESAHLLASRRL